MKEFLRSTLATITGVLICGFIFIILGVTMLAGIVASSESETLVMPNSVFTLELKGTVQERYQPSPVDQFFEDQISTYGLEDILSSIQKAKENEQIKVSTCIPEHWHVLLPLYRPFTAHWPISSKAVSF